MNGLGTSVKRLSRMIGWHRITGIQSTAVIFLSILIVAAITTQWIDNYFIAGPAPEHIQHSQAFKTFISEPKCFLKCLQNNPLAQIMNSSAAEACPGYFQWIHEDLSPWKVTGISKEMVERAKDFAHIRVVIVNGRVYVEKYKSVYQTRDVVTIWGIMQLLRFYPGKLPDMDLMFECGDKPVILKRDYGGSKALIPPPLFHYCGDEFTFDIAFPDWSFWGWPELLIKPWEILRKDLQEGNNRIEWKDREPYAFWKGNVLLGPARRHLVKCNVSDDQEWNARIYNVDWQHERKEGFRTADLASQCSYRYKIYVEGKAWSVSQKYILACDSVNLLINPQYYDFYTRGLLPTVHYWPINGKDKCRSIKFAVEWGNKHTKEAQEIGKAGSRYVQKELKMKYVYDYMYHLLQEYGKLLNYQPTVPEGALEVCPETLICSTKGTRKKFRKYSMVNGSADSGPCTLQPPNDSATLQAFVKRKEELIKQVQQWEASGIRKKIFL